MGEEVSMLRTTETEKGVGKAKRSTVVRVFGREYRVRSDEKEETVQRVARYVDKQMREVAKSSPSPDPLSVAVLVALNVTGEYLPGREDREARAGMTVDRVRKLIHLVDGAMNQTVRRRPAGRSR